jgi:hypothetical protein
MTTSIPQIVLAVVMALLFIHFLYAAMRTFVLPDALTSPTKRVSVAFSHE